MSIDVFSMSLTRRGGTSNSPNYSITIYGDGRVVYKGKANVEVMGKVEASIDRNKFRSLLVEFKNSNFLSFKDKYIIDDMPDLPSTVTSLSIVGENNEIVTKTVRHSHGETGAPKALLRLEDKIDKIAGSDKWVGSDERTSRTSSDLASVSSSSKNKRLSFHSFKKKRVKILTIVVSAVIILILYAMQSGFIDFSFFGNTSGNDSTQSDKYAPPQISILTTAGNVTGLGNYSPKYVFEQGDTIYVYEEYTSVFHKVNDHGLSDFSVNVTILDSYKTVRYFDSVDVYHENKVEEGRYWSFNTDDTWPDGWYLVTSSLTDHISNKSTTADVIFTLINLG